MSDQTVAPLALERFAEAYAHVLEYPSTDRPTLLAALEMDEATFEAARSYWSRAFAAGISKGNPTFVLQFAQVYGRAEYRARVRRRAPSDVRSEVEVATADTAPRVVPRQMRPLKKVEEPKEPTAADAGANDPTAPNVALPSYLLGEGMTVSADETAMVDGKQVLDALRSRGVPFDSEAQVVAPPPMPIADEQSGETAIADGRALRAVLVARGVLGPSDIAGTPFTQTAPPLAFERFVHYRQELARGRPFDEIAHAMGLTPASLASGEGYWRSRLEADGEVRAAFEATWNRSYR